ncbi:MAG: LysM peptidoglycan-binding domain-containing protein [Acidobacteria bacterium]|nr:LysM peptidoglycan-binding domain-containing protein [Acidobacteriota bacterium]
MLKKSVITLSAAATLVVALPLEAQSLRGSSASMDRQNAQARAHDFTFLRDGRHVTTFVNSGLLVRLPGNSNYELNAVSYPYARPEVKLFVERLSAQFRGACGEKLVVTSLTRPQNGQPRNASSRSVHPTGMALDIRRHNTPACRSWLERVLLSLEGSQVLEVSLEHRPPHYHIALFPDPYRSYVTRLGASTTVERAAPGTYVVSRGETLWRIARKHGTTPAAIQRANDLRDTTIYPGQELRIPATR